MNPLIPPLWFQCFDLGSVASDVLADAHGLMDGDGLVVPFVGLTLPVIGAVLPVTMGEILGSTQLGHGASG
jgi:hypothetical protein